MGVQRSQEFQRVFSEVRSFKGCSVILQVLGQIKSVITILVSEDTAAFASQTESSFT